MGGAWKVIRYGGEFLAGTFALGFYIAMMEPSYTFFNAPFATIVLPAIVIAALMLWYHRDKENTK